MENNDFSDFKRKTHPLKRVNFLSRLFFCWLPSYLKKGLRKDVEEDSMYLVNNSQKSAYLGKRLEYYWEKELRKKKPSLMWALLLVFKIELLSFAAIATFAEITKISLSVLISQLVRYVEDGYMSTNINEVYICAGAIIFVNLILPIFSHHYQMHVMTLGMKMRIAACAIIYRKALKLNKSALVETTIGQMVNLLSNDVARFEYSCELVYFLILAPLSTTIVMIILYFYVGITGLVGCAFMLGFIPIQMFMASLSAKFRLKTAIRTDERVRLMNEIITGIQVIKMYTWEKPFANLINLARRKEVTEIWYISMIRAVMKSCTMTLCPIAISLCVLTYVLTGNTLTASYAFTVTSFYNCLKQSVTQFFPLAVTQFAETKVSISRIQHFLMYDELNNENQPILSECSDDAEKENKKNVCVKIKNGAVKWVKSFAEYNLRDISFEAGPSQLIAIVGTVGSGKSTLLHVILKELDPLEGSISVSGSVSYASQEPWVFGGNIRQNILFGEEYDKKKYDEVVKACALERDFALFPHGDRTLVGERGATLSGGQKARINLARAVYKDSDIYLLDDPLSAVDAHVGKQLFKNCVTGYLKNKCVIFVTHQLQYLHSADCIYILDEGKIKASGTYQSLRNSSSTFTKLLSSSKDDEKKENVKKLTRAESFLYEDTEVESKIIEENKEEMAQGTVSSRVYNSYLKAGGHWLKTVALVAFFILNQIFTSSADIFLSIWVNVEKIKEEENVVTYDDNFNASLDTAIYQKPLTDDYFNELIIKHNSVIIYSSLILIAVFLAVARSIFFFNYCLTASTKLHKKMFLKILYSPMLFFNINPSGRILNRFSKDLGSLDEILPNCIVDTVGVGLMVCGAIVTIGIVNHWVLLPAGIMLFIFYCFRKIFLVSSRHIKRVENTTRSPIYTHMSASLQGLTTIRAFKAEPILISEFDNFQDSYTSAFYMFLTANRGFGFWLDLHCVFFISFVVISILFMQSESLGGNVGLTLTQAVTLSGVFQWGMRQWSELENQMTSVERVQQYADLPTEPDVHQEDPPINWPSTGNILFKNMSLRYSANSACVLKNLAFEVRPKEKIGIVGRTGAGKSSLIQALFRLSEIEGSILIDDVDTKAVQLRLLRSKLSIIPQEPVLFSGTLRKNLDPFDEYQDDVLWSAIEEVELKNAVNELSSGLDSVMAEGGANFSVGQRQLVCLARAIIRNNKILVLDEATANVDPITDAIIQNTIRKKFADCTVLTIAHRLHTIMDSDKVLVMDAGQSVEFDHPHVLLKEKGIFYNLVRQTGVTMAEYLQSIASKNFAERISGT